MRTGGNGSQRKGYYRFWDGYGPPELKIVTVDRLANPLVLLPQWSPLAGGAMEKIILTLWCLDQEGLGQHKRIPKKMKLWSTRDRSGQDSEEQAEL